MSDNTPTAPPKHQLPTLEELHHDTELAIKTDALNEILSVQPPQSWIKVHPFVNIEVVQDNKKVKVPLPYIPVEKVKYLLTRIFQRWECEILTVQQVFNSVCVTVRLRVLNPITGEWMSNDGVGAVGVQTDAGAGASEMTKIKSDAVMKAAPAAESYALKNAAEKFGNIFGGNIIKDLPPFVGSYSNGEKATDMYEQVKELYVSNMDLVPENEQEGIERILNNREVASYPKVLKYLNSLKQPC